MKIGREKPGGNLERKKKEEEKISRRKFLKLLILALFGSIGYLLLKKYQKKKEEIRQEIEEKNQVEKTLSLINEILISFENNNTQPDYSEIEKEINEFLGKEKILSPLIKTYFLPIKKGLEEFSIDNLWETKINLLEKEKLTEEISKMRELKLSLIDEYKKFPKGYFESLEGFQVYLKFCYLETLGVLNLDKLLEDKRFNFDEEKKNKIKEILKEETFLNYFINLLLGLILNEISYISEDKSMNKKLLEYLLRKYGLRFLCSIPSLYDVRASFGPFQLTDLVIGEEKDKFYPINFMNNFIESFDQEIKEKYNLPDYKLPNNIYNLRLREHFRAEILLLVFYLLEIVKELDLKTLNDCLKRPEWFYKQLIYYLGGSHHLPESSKKLFLEFLKIEENITGEKGFVDYIEKLKKEENLINYLRKLKKNLDLT